MRKKSTAFVILVILPVSWLLTGCVNGSREASASLAESLLYQPPVLRLKAGQEIQQEEGVYRPQTDETWHSDARFRQLEQENIDLAAAIAARKP